MLLVPAARSKRVKRVKRWVSWAVQPSGPVATAEEGGVEAGYSAKAAGQAKEIMIEGLVGLGEAPFRSNVVAAFLPP
jgi:hypothetical protein